jgi:glycerol-1-phosphatase
VETLAQLHDCLLVDLDGTVFRGSEPVAGAAETLAATKDRTFYVTNNASRTPYEVAQHLREMGFDARPEDIVTSAQGAARLLQAQLAAGSAVLVVGTDALAAEVANVGLKPVRRWADSPVAVVQGHSPHTGWPDLAEAALAIRGGALWIAANVDLTLPTERGLLPGNGSMVAALRAATNAVPQVAGKPEPTLLTDALSRGDFHAPLVIGDRLDTDIAGANAASMPSLMVLTGVSTAREAVHAPIDQRPTYIGADLRALEQPAKELEVGPQAEWHTEVGPGAVTVTSNGAPSAPDGLAAVRAAADAAWRADFGDRPFQIVAGDEAARDALQRWSVLGPSNGHAGG